MMAVCSRLLFKPYLKLRDQRRDSTEGARHEAQSMQKRAQEMVENYDAQLTRARQRGAEEMQRLRAEGSARERELLGIARDEALKALEAARLRISTEAGMAKKQLEQQTTALTRQIVTKILGREAA
jgi:F-type H+-transporting ATPase subunit b